MPVQGDDADGPVTLALSGTQLLAYGAAKAMRGHRSVVVGAIEVRMATGCEMRRVLGRMIGRLRNEYGPMSVTQQACTSFAAYTRASVAALDRRLNYALGIFYNRFIKYSSVEEYRAKIMRSRVYRL